MIDLRVFQHYNMFIPNAIPFKEYVMTYTSRNNGQITDFWPDNDDETIYIESIGGISIPSLIQIAQEKWPNISLSDIEITSEKIHTHCITYDLYDAGDWTEFVVIKKTGDTPADPQELIQSRLDALEEGAKKVLHIIGIANQNSSGYNKAVLEFYNLVHGTNQK